MMSEPEPLTAEEIAALRVRTDRSNTLWDQHFKYRIVATLEALTARVAELEQAAEERLAAPTPTASRSP
jgi:hypothetical protein